MAEKIIRTTFLLRRGTSAQWEENNPVLGTGEPGFELDTKKLKIGDGQTPFMDLPYIGVDEVNFEIPGLDTAEVGQIAVKGENGLEWKDESVSMTEDQIKELINNAIFEAEKGKEYTAAELQTAVSKSGFVKLAADVDLGTTGQLVIPEGEEVILDLGDNDIIGSKNELILANGGTVTIRGTGKIESSARPVIARNGGKVIVEGCLIKSLNSNGVSASGEGSQIVFNNGEVEAQEYGVNLINGGAIEINGGVIEAFDNCAVGGNGSRYIDENGNVTTTNTGAEQKAVNVVMNGGKLISHIQSSGYVANGVYMPNDGSFTMNGGEIIADNGCGICIRAGEVILNGGKIETSGDPTIKGKCGDSRVVVPCAPVVYDKQANYPKTDTMKLTISENMEFVKPEGLSKLVTIPADLEDANIVLPNDWDNDAE